VESTTNSCSHTETKAATETSLTQPNCHDVPHPSSKQGAADADVADETDRYSDVFTADGTVLPADSDVTEVEAWDTITDDLTTICGTSLYNDDEAEAVLDDRELSPRT